MTEAKSGARHPLAARVLTSLQEHGLLLVQDARLPSVCTLVAGEPVRGSWWGHPEGSRIWHLLGDLDEHPDILFAKLVSGKVTLVHRRLWPAFLAVATSREAWQKRGLTPGARALLHRVDAEGLVAALDFVPPAGEKATACAKQLEQRLLVDAYQEHSESGKHVKRLRSWASWMTGRGLTTPKPAAAAARGELEAALQATCRVGGGKGRLPWQVG